MPVLIQMLRLKLPDLVEDLDAVALAVAYVEQSGVAHVDAVHHFGEDSADAVLGFFGGGLAAPLAQEFAVLVEYGDAAVAVAVGNVDVSVGGIDDDAGGVVEAVGRGVEGFGFAGAVD